MNEKTTKINSANAEFIPSLPHAEGRTRRDRSPDLAVPSKTIAKICMALLRYSLPTEVPFFKAYGKEGECWWRQTSPKRHRSTKGHGTYDYMAKERAQIGKYVSRSQDS